MDSDTTFYTATMARVHADQGRLDEAARIYRFLLEKEPQRDDLRQALTAVTHQMEQSPVDRQALTSLVERWAELMLRRKTLNQLQKSRLLSSS